MYSRFSFIIIDVVLLDVIYECAFHRSTSINIEVLKDISEMLYQTPISSDVRSGHCRKHLTS